MSDAMTNEATPAPLWTDRRIREEVHEYALGMKAKHSLRKMKHEYEQERHQLHARIVELEAGIKALYQTHGAKLDAYALGFNNGYDHAKAESEGKYE